MFKSRRHKMSLNTAGWNRKLLFELFAAPSAMGDAAYATAGEQVAFLVVTLGPATIAVGLVLKLDLELVTTGEHGA